VRQTRSVVVTKRDGTRECFSLPKLRSCLAKVLRTCSRDVRVAEPLARAVAVHLARTNDGGLCSTEYICRCVCAALSETGLGDVAEELAAHRRLRDARRRRVRVVDAAEPGHGPTRWRKGALVATLRGVYDLRSSVARFLAGRIEEQVFVLGYRQVSKTLLAEVVRNEVLAWGLLDVPANVVANDQSCGGSVATRQPKKET
jgi:hypothetical protein